MSNCWRDPSNAINRLSQSIFFDSDFDRLPCTSRDNFRKQAAIVCFVRYPPEGVRICQVQQRRSNAVRDQLDIQNVQLVRINTSRFMDMDVTFVCKMFSPLSATTLAYTRRNRRCKILCMGSTRANSIHIAASIN